MEVIAISPRAIDFDFTFDASDGGLASTYVGTHASTCQTTDRRVNDYTNKEGHTGLIYRAKLEHLP
jgi:hypothetical protein